MKFRVLVLIVVSLFFPLRVEGGMTGRGEASSVFQPGRIVRDRVLLLQIRRERRGRWRERLHKDPIDALSVGESAPVPADGGEIDEHREAAEDRDVLDRIRSYVRRGQCPPRLPADILARCREALRAATVSVRRRIDLGQAYRRGRNSEQFGTRVQDLDVADRLQQIVPRASAPDRATRRSFRRSHGES